ncbi:MAG: MFS transporter [Lactobacillaceae bacterium]|jgi:CP family cyanate transporter-like MFS transporter|nr:MFS transporter [Lactobacillaceae bacterium]
MKQNTRFFMLLFVTSIFMIGFIMRVPITTLPLMVGDLARELHVSQQNLGMLTTIPLIMFVLISNVAAKTIAIFGLKRAVTLALAAIVLGSLLRVVVTIPTVFIGTILIGLGIAHLNVLMPALVTQYFPSRIGVYTSVYSLALMLGSGVFNFITAPVTATMGWYAMMILLLAVPVLVIVIWLIMQNNLITFTNTWGQKHAETGDANFKVWTNLRAWPFLILFGAQSLINYTFVAWFPALMVRHHVSLVSIGLIMTLYALIALPLSILLPSIIANVKTRGLLIILSSAGAIGLVSAIFLFWQDTNNFWYWALISSGIGVTTGIYFLAAMTLFSVKTNNALETAKLAGMAQAGGYSIAATGPVLYGIAFEIDPVGNLQNYIFVGVMLVLIVMGFIVATTKHLQVH